MYQYSESILKSGNPEVKNSASKVLLYLTLLRPYQWVKNLLLFSGLFFSTSLFNDGIIWISVAAFGIFCLASSGIYILNDLFDIKADMLHPVKKYRPIASGDVPVKSAVLLMLTFLSAALISSYLLEKKFYLIVLIYIILNIGYSMGLKKVVILDVFIVATGFLLRAFAGCVVIHVDVTPWLFICTLSLALLLSFAKRRNELNLLKDSAKDHRETLQYYNAQILDIILTICSATAIGAYSLYTMADETILRFGSQRLIITTPFVMYGVFRCLYLIYTQNKGGDPTKLLVGDFPTIVNGILWVFTVGFVIYGSNLLPF
jgi:4-hydroxybenzoate polyprenyltransferase